jgi:hypothetical protein
LEFDHVSSLGNPTGGKASMVIACLGWGSLIWDHRDLPLQGKWFCDGPFLPIEYARQSSGRRITLVLVPKSFTLVRSLWVPLNVKNLLEARKALGKRECKMKERPESCVDYWPRGSRNRFATRQISRWARGLEIDAVVWTNLPPEFDGEEKIPTADQVMSYLHALNGDEQNEAKRYIRKTPRQIVTEYRRRIEAELGWTPESLV